MKIAYLIDSSANMPETPEQDVYMVPLFITKTENKKETVYRAGIDIDLEGLSKQFAPHVKFQTGQTQISEVEQKVGELLKEYDHVVGIPIDRILSGTFNSWQMIENEIGSDRFHVVDALAVENGIGFTIENLKEHFARTDRFDVKEIDAVVAKDREKLIGAIVVNDVSQLIAGGRLRGWKAFFVKTLKIKILIKMHSKDGVLEHFDKSHGDADARKVILDYADKMVQWRKNGIRHVSVMTTILDEKTNRAILEEFRKLLPPGTKIAFTNLSSVISVHTGMNAYAVYIQAK